MHCAPTPRCARTRSPALVEAVHVSPFAPAWFRDTVMAAVNQFGLDRPVCQSRLTVAPIL